VRILLDEQLPRQLASFLVGHDVRTVQQESWAGTKNGELLAHAEAAGFEVFLTGDQNIEFQQNLETSRLAILVLQAGPTRSRIYCHSFHPCSQRLGPRDPGS
jgi:predicted nuclease of predicted toxin-antitoxin system